MKVKKANLCGKRIKLARTMKEMHQVDLAAALAVDCDLEKMNQSVISAIERGTRQVSDVELAALADVLDVGVEWLLFGDKKAIKK
jgi:transcriptional regulator with XRE-family HTH domain